MLILKVSRTVLLRHHHQRLLPQQYPWRLLGSVSRARAFSSCASNKGQEESFGASPIFIGSDLCLYSSPKDLAVVAATAYRGCQLGSGLGFLGAAFFLLGTTAPMPVLALISVYAVLNTYKMLVLSRQRIQSIAMRHVEQLTLLPTATIGNVEKFESLEMSDVSERFKVTPEVELKIRTANLDMWMKLVEPVTIEGGDELPSFGDVCKSTQLLYLDELAVSFNPDAFRCANPELLSAISSTSKVIFEQAIECRQDVSPLLLSQVGGANFKFRTAGPTDWAPPPETSDSGERMVRWMFQLGKEPDFAAPGGLKPVGSSMMTRPPAEDLEFLGKTYAREGAAFLACALLSCAFCLGVDPDFARVSSEELAASSLHEGSKVRLKEDGRIGEIYQVMTASKSFVVALKGTNEMVRREVSELQLVTNSEEQAQSSVWEYLAWRRKPILLSLINANGVS